ncbi:bifunctional metallophosphatase/5'-nucleotidase [uncultured Rhodospira sp.]|uniref:bifunctional metallophosphatase/5'-nucleotidase n=1 Tax=uncultured Rhodospira sp. TaxID=1936189 RepID=UPI00261D307F|nr:bifunctional metallophosphatase/5'-nucleotidase [uncultured Rhodospira sp.]
MSDVYSPAQADGDAFTLQLLHASDLEGGVDAIDRAANFAAIVDYFKSAMGNTLTISAGDNVIPGPFFNAALFTDDAVFNDAANTLFGLTSDEMYAALEGARGRIDMAIMNAIGFDASALGNHEFDLGTGTMADYIRPSLGDEGLTDDEWLGTTFPYLSANLDFSGDGSLSGTASTSVLDMSSYVSGGPTESAAGTESPRIAPGALFTVDGELIGVVGATTPLLSTISSPGDVSVAAGGNDMAALAAILQPVIDEMIAAGSNKIILTTHLQQIALEKELAGLLSGVDIIIAGGSDTLQADATDTLRSGDVAAETYPFVTTNADGDTTVIVSTDGEYSYVGRLVVGFDANGRVNADSINADESGAYATTDDVVTSLWGEADPFAEGDTADQVQDLVAGVEAIVNEQDGVITGTTDVFLEGRRSFVRTEETNLGNLTADANLALAKSHDSSVMISIKNGGGIRAQIGEVLKDGSLVAPQGNSDAGKDVGDVSQLDIVNALRFNNGLTLQTVTYEQLAEMLEHAVAASGDGATPGQFAQVSGVRYSYDTSLDAGSRIVNAAIVDGQGSVVETLVVNGQFVADPTETVRIVTLDFLQKNNGDGYLFQDYVAALGEETANVVHLEEVLSGAGNATFADPGSEQDALAEYLMANYPDGNGFAGAETPASEDLRIQNLADRDDAVFGSATSLFDESLYLANNLDVAAAVAAGVFSSGAEHYDLFGRHEGRDPNAFFDTDYYLNTYSDVADAGVNPFDHYNTHGWQEGRDPSATFDTSAYLGNNTDVAGAEVNPLFHLIQYGLSEGRYSSDVADVA